MKPERTPAEVNIHLRARVRDRALLDQAAGLVGANRSQFMIASALKEAKNVILDQTSIQTDNQAFQRILDWLDAPSIGWDEQVARRVCQPAPPDGGSSDAAIPPGLAPFHHVELLKFIPNGPVP